MYTPEEANRVLSLPIWAEATPTDIVYDLPIPNGVRTPPELIDRYPLSRLLLYGSTWIKPFGAGHVASQRWALDFLVPDGTPVLAPADGIIKIAVEEHDEWGDDSSYANKANVLALAHEHGEYSYYAHLGQGSITAAGVKLGDTVEHGQQIGKVGKTGWTDRDHLHFAVLALDARSENPVGEISRKIRFPKDFITFTTEDLNT